MPKLYNPRDWYWRATDGRAFGSARAGVVSDPQDPALVAWLADGTQPTVWPRDDAGAQTDAALHAVLAPYGLVPAASPVPLDLSAYAKAKRDATEASGITVNGVAVASDPDSQTRVANAYSGMLVTGAAQIRFKATAGFLVLTLDQVKAVGSALFAHTQACFDAEDQVDAGLAANPPTVTTAAQIDAVFAAVKTSY